MLKRHRTEIYVNHERWLVSYADFVTLLFAFFVVMYSVSQVNDLKYQELSSTLTELFSKQSSDNAHELPPSDTNEVDKSIQVSSVEALPRLAEKFHERLESLIDDGAIDVASNELWLQITLNNRILFTTGSVSPSEQAKQVFEEVADILREVNNPIQVEGFTDNQSINTQQFPSNWELSAARASSIVKLLVSNGVAPERLSAIGYGEFQPIADNATQAGRAQNRRVVLMISKYKRERPQSNNSPNNTNLLDNTEPNNLSQSTSIVVEEGENTGLDETQLKPITLDNGEHLFTNDPDLPRLSR